MAAAALIDLGVIQRLVATLMETITALGVIHVGEPQPEVAAWVREVGLSVVSIPRQRTADEPDIADFELELEVATNNNSSAYAIGSASSIVRGVWMDALLQDPSTGTAVHQIDVNKVEVQIAKDPDPNRNIRTSKVLVSGLVQRWTGTDVVDFVD